MSIEPPLKGIHVVELSHTILRPSCGMILADLALQRFSSRGDLDSVKECHGQPQGNRGRRWLEVGQANAPRRAPVD
jgi:hypothetical protein